MLARTHMDNFSETENALNIANSSLKRLVAQIGKLQTLKNSLEEHITALENAYESEKVKSAYKPKGLDSKPQTLKRPRVKLEDPTVPEARQIPSGYNVKGLDLRAKNLKRVKVNLGANAPSAISQIAASEKRRKCAIKKEKPCIVIR